MRAALLALVVLSGWLAAIPSAAVAAAPRDEWVEARPAPQEAILVGRSASAELIRFGATPRFALPPSLALTLLAPTTAFGPGKTADAAHQHFVLARPIQPRAPPRARS